MMLRNFRLKLRAARFIPVACCTLAGLVIPLASLPARAAVEVHGTSASVHVVAQNAKVSEVLKALTERLERLQCKETANLDDVISGSYKGSVEDVLERILRGFDYVITTQGAVLDILVVGKSASAPAIVPSPAPAAVALIPPAFAAPLPIGLPPTPARGR
jgi:hypothetical protein